MFYLMIVITHCSEVTTWDYIFQDICKSVKTKVKVEWNITENSEKAEKILLLDLKNVLK